MVPRGLVYIQPSGLCQGKDMGAEGSQGSSSWFSVLLEMFVSLGEHPPHHESSGKLPGFHCRQMAAGSLGVNPAGISSCSLYPKACIETQEQSKEPIFAWREVLVHSQAPLPQCPLGDTLLPRTKPCRWDSTGIVAIPRHRAHSLAVTYSPCHHCGWPQQRCCSDGTSQPSLVC